MPGEMQRHCSVEAALCDRAQAIANHQRTGSAYGVAVGALFGRPKYASRDIETQPISDVIGALLSR
jgi:hypothetical protein